MKSLLLTASFLATSIAAPAFASDEGGQQFFFRHQIAGISSTDGNLWGDGEESEIPEEPEEPEEEPEEEPYTVGWGTFFGITQPTGSDWVMPSASAQPGASLSFDNGITMRCVGCEETWFLRGLYSGSGSGHFYLGDNLWSYGGQWGEYLSIDLGGAYHVDAIYRGSSWQEWDDGQNTIALYLDGQLVKNIGSAGGAIDAVGDEIRFEFLPSDGHMAVEFMPFVITPLQEG